MAPILELIGLLIWIVAIGTILGRFFTPVEKRKRGDDEWF